MAVPASSASPQEKKRGMGCCGCGCLILVLLALLALGILGTATYLGYHQGLAFTSTTPAVIPTFDGGDDAYNRARQKVSAFNHDLENHLASTIRLNSDELNTLIAHSPNFDHNRVHFFIAMTGSQARVQTSLPTDLLAHGLIKGRFANIDATFGLTFDASTRMLLFLPQHLKAGDQTVYDANGPETGGSTAQQMHQFTIGVFNQYLTEMVCKSPEGNDLINRAKSIEIKNGELVIEIE